ncbi:MAG: hypothetical protein LBQ78_06975 [Tannerellaceae bacterium]|jgi:hypothetical protein|nr:hypothetical protein [Tannerellaceae bacterium]
MKKILFFVCTTCCLHQGSAQIHIGSQQPPDPSAGLEVSAPDKGVALPEIALASIYDTTIKKPVDGLLIFNTTSDPQNGLHQGIYFWSGKKKAWDQIVTKDTFGSMASDFAIESAYLVANSSTNQSISSGFNTLTFSSPPNIDINKKKSFNGNTFTVPEDGFYKITGGIEITNGKGDKRDKARVRLLFSNPKHNSPEVVAERLYIPTVEMPLTPSVFYIGHFQKGETITLQGNGSLIGLATLTRKYLYISAFFK